MKRILKTIFKWLAGLCLVGFVALVIFLVGVVFSIYFFGVEYDFFKLPDVKVLRNLKPIESSFVYAKDNALIGCYAKEYRTILLPEEIPQILEQAILASEDHNFYRHWGADPLAILRAARDNFTAGRIVQGGSTLDQQVVKNLLLTPEKTFERKVKEALLAFKLEREFSKREILGFYVNLAFLGRGRYGFEAASNSYFGKSAKDLKIHEAAFLAGLINRPDIISAERRNRVLRLMREQGFLSAGDYQKALAEPLEILPASQNCKNEAPYFVEKLRKDYKDKLPLLTGGLRIYTTMDLAIQKKAEEALKASLNKYRARHPENSELARGAVVVLDTKTGEVRAMVCGEDFKKSEFDNCTQSKRQPGSAFKPFTYAAALELGWKRSCSKKIGEKCGVFDSPVRISMGRAGTHLVENYPYPKPMERYLGRTSMDIAIGESRNAATVWLALKIGIKRVIDMAHRLGIHSELEPYPTTSIGASEVTLLELASAYISFVNGGYKISPIMAREIFDSYGKGILSQEPILPQSEEERVLPAEVANDMKELLEGVVSLPHGTAKRLRQTLKEGELACKTGTATNAKDEPTDNWIVCLTPSYTIGVWIGLDTKLSLGDRETGSVNALPVVEQILRELNLLEPEEKFEPLFKPMDTDEALSIDETNEHENQETPMD